MSGASITPETLIELCSIASISDDKREACGSDLEQAIVGAIGRGPGYVAPDPVPPIVSASEKVASAALALLGALETCDRQTTSLMAGLLLEGTIEDATAAVRDIWTAADHLADSMPRADGRDRRAPGAPPKKIGDAGVTGSDLLVYSLTSIVYRHGGRLTFNEREQGGGLTRFFSVVREAVPPDLAPTHSISRLKAIRRQVTAQRRRREVDNPPA